MPAPTRGRLGHNSNDDLLSSCLRRFADTADHNTALGVGNGCWGLARLARAGLPLFAGGRSGASALVMAAIGAGVRQVQRLLEEQGCGGPVVSLSVTFVGDLEVHVAQISPSIFLLCTC
jgi:hypothetical protein